VFATAATPFPGGLERGHANTNVYLDISGSGPWTDGIPLVYAAIGGQSCIPIDFARVLWAATTACPRPSTSPA